jgi:hypothetical protein
MTKICRICGEQFVPALKHPGFINVCLEEDCRANARSFDPKLYIEETDVSLVMKHERKARQTAG